MNRPTLLRGFSRRGHTFNNDEGTAGNFHHEDNWCVTSPNDKYVDRDRAATLVMISDGNNQIILIIQ